MKLRIATAVALLAVTYGAARAAEPPASPSATPIKHAAAKTCIKRADAKQLTGSERAQFLKACQAPGKPP